MPFVALITVHRLVAWTCSGAPLGTRVVGNVSWRSSLAVNYKLSGERAGVVLGFSQIGPNFGLKSHPPAAMVGVTFVHSASKSVDPLDEPATLLADKLEPADRGSFVPPGYSVDSTCHNMLWLERFGGGGENGTIWGRFNLHCLFKQPKEKQSTGSRGTSVETERKLVEIVVQVVWTNSALMGAQ